MTNINTLLPNYYVSIILLYQKESRVLGLPWF